MKFPDAEILDRLNFRKNNNLSFSSKKMPYEYERKLLAKMDTGAFTKSCLLNESETVALKSLASLIYPQSEEEKRMEIDIISLKVLKLMLMPFQLAKFLSQLTY